MTWIDSVKKLFASGDAQELENSGESSPSEQHTQPWQSFQPWTGDPFAAPMTPNADAQNSETSTKEKAPKPKRGRKAGQKQKGSVQARPIPPLARQRLPSPQPEQPRRGFGPQPQSPMSSPFQQPGNRNTMGVYGQPGVRRAPMVDAWAMPMPRQPVAPRAPGRAPMHTPPYPSQQGVYVAPPLRQRYPHAAPGRRFREPWF